MLQARDEGSERFSIIPAINWHINLDNAKQCCCFLAIRMTKYKKRKKNHQILKAEFNICYQIRKWWKLGILLGWRSGVVPEVSPSVTPLHQPAVFINVVHSLIRETLNKEPRCPFAPLKSRGELQRATVLPRRPRMDVLHQTWFFKFESLLTLWVSSLRDTVSLNLFFF